MKCLTFSNYVLAEFTHQIQHECFSHYETSGGQGKEGLPENCVPLLSLKASPKYVVFSLLAISQPLPLFCASLECALEDETYEDGAETQVECNRCVCACGNWVCTAMTCEGPYALQTIIVLGFVQKGVLLFIFQGHQLSRFLLSPAFPQLLYGWLLHHPPCAPCWPNPSWFCSRGQKICNWVGGNAAGVCSLDWCHENSAPNLIGQSYSASSWLGACTGQTGHCLQPYMQV